QVLADRPVAYYRLDERSGRIAHDSSGHGYDGIIGEHVVTGAPPLIADAPTSMEFGGADRSAASEDIRVKGRPACAIERNVTVEAWVLPYDTSIYGNNSGDVTLVAYGEDTDPDNQHCRYALELDAHSHVFHFPAVIHGRLHDNEITGVRS